MPSTKEYVSARYIKEKSWPIEQLLKLVETTETDNIADAVYPAEIAESFAVIAKELGIKIPDV